MEIKKLVQGLHPLERKIVPFLTDDADFNSLVSRSGLKDIEVMRALQWLENKGVLKIKTDAKEVVNLDINGIEYLKNGLPEMNLLRSLIHGEMPVEKAREKSKILEEELNICLGSLRGKAAINIMKMDNALYISITDNGKKLLQKPSLEEMFLKKRFPIELSRLAAEERFALESLKRRKRIIKLELLKIKTIKLTPLGKDLSKQKILKDDAIEVLTPELLKQGAWQKRNFRAYDVKINVPRLFFGKKQPYRAFLDDVRKKFISLGFEEMSGPIVETDFWDMDALFMPQFHSARDIHDAYYVKEPAYGKIDDKIVERVKKAHENGFDTGSRGWRYKFDIERTKRHILRTQGTACSARMLASSSLKIPGKYFGITRCFRYDVVDSTHNVDFNQTEGIVVGNNLNMRHLFGLLKMFAREFANADEVKVVPGYFPFTEPSCELFAKHPQLGWIELGGAGIFRPEVVKPLIGKDSKDTRVLAWGLGIDRIAMFKLGIKDIRQLFSHDLGYLRNARLV